MAIPATLPQTSPPSRVSTGKTAWLSVVFVSALVFWLAIAFPYLIGRADQMRLYETERLWIILHVALGTMALLTGPVQLWLGFARRNMALHRKMGKVYMAAIGLNAVVALRLAATPSAGLVFGLGLSALAVVWLLTTGMAYVAIRGRQIALEASSWAWRGGRGGSRISYRRATLGATVHIRMIQPLPNQ